MRIQIKELKPGLWPDLEELFGASGACGGCWCMWWRLQKGERWEEVKGAPAQRRLHQGVLSGTIHGLLAYADGQVAGWCTWGPRVDFPRLDRAPSLRCLDAERVWSIPCFFVKRSFQRQGIGKALLEQALRLMRNKKVPIVEAYPVRTAPDATFVPAFSFTGTLSMFLEAGFEMADSKEKGRQRVRLILERQTSALPAKRDSSRKTQQKR